MTSSSSEKPVIKSNTLSSLYDKLTEAKQKLEDSKLNIVNSFEDHKISDLRFLEDLNQLNNDVQNFKKGKVQKNVSTTIRSTSVNPRVKSPLARRISDKMILQEENFSPLKEKTTDRRSYGGLNITMNSIKSSNTNYLSYDSSTNDKLFLRSKVIEAKKRNLQESINKEIKKAASGKKVSDSTMSLIIHNIETTLISVLEEIKYEKRGFLTFEEFGRFLTILNIFNEISYDSNNKFKTNYFIVANQNSDFFDSKKYKRRLDEMVFHEQIWRLFSQNKQKKFVECELIYNIIRVLIDPNRLPVKTASATIDEYLLKFHNNILTEEYEEFPYNKEIKRGWTTEDLVKNFRDININRIAQLRTGYLKKNKFDEIKKKIFFPFSPQINKTSEYLEAKNTSNFLSKYNIETNKSMNKSGISNMSNSASLNPEERYKLLYKKKEIADQNLNELKMKIESENNAECTFIPNINKASSQSRKLVDAQTLVERLYTVSSTQEKIELSQHVKEKRELKELEQCTFNPATNNTIMRTNEDVPKGYEKAVGRVRYAHSNYLKKKIAIERIPTGENYEKIRKENIKPFSFLSEEKQKKEKPFVFIDVNVGLGRTGRIGLHENDDPKKVAKNFGVVFQLNAEMMESLEKLLESQLENHHQSQLE